jgi:hypothetical protein
LEGLEKSISSFFHLCFAANLQYRYPVGSANQCTFLLHFAAKLDEHGTIAKRTKRDQTDKEDKSTKIFDEIISNYATRLLVIKSFSKKLSEAVVDMINFILTTPLGCLS